MNSSSSSNGRYSITSSSTSVCSSPNHCCSLRSSSSMRSSSVRYSHNINSSNSTRSRGSNMKYGEWRSRSSGQNRQTCLNSRASGAVGSLASCNGSRGSCRIIGSSSRAIISASESNNRNSGRDGGDLEGRALTAAEASSASCYSSCLFAAAFNSEAAAAVTPAANCVNLCGSGSAAGVSFFPLSASFSAASKSLAATAASAAAHFFCSASNMLYEPPSSSASLSPFPTAAAAAVTRPAAPSPAADSLLRCSSTPLHLLHPPSKRCILFAGAAARTLHRDLSCASYADSPSSPPSSSCCSSSSCSYSSTPSPSPSSSISSLPLRFFRAASPLSVLLRRSSACRSSFFIAAQTAGAAAAPLSGARPAFPLSRFVSAAAARGAAAGKPLCCCAAGAAPPPPSQPFSSFFSSSHSRLFSSSSAAPQIARAGVHAAAADEAAQKKKKYIFSIDEALYAAKEANVYTTEELQKIILRSPSFSPDTSPLLLENIFSSVEVDTPERFEEEWGAAGATAQGLEEEEDISGDVITPPPSFSGNGAVDMWKSTAAAPAAPRESTISSSSSGPRLAQASSLVPAAIIQAFNPSWVKTFTHNNREWKVQAEGRGTRKRAAAHVIIRLGTGQVRVNEDEDLYVRWPYYYNRMDVLQPFYLTNTANLYDVFICARGGGPSGQAAAARLAIGRALVDACPACKPDLEEDLVLYEDLRQRMPKMPGRMKARKTRAWTKR